MKKALLLVCILSVSVITTACINNLAVQELNNKAAAYMEKGDYIAAIERLKSSIDLDDSLFQSHYNLAIAYTKNEEYVNALNAYKKAQELNPEFADVYYSLAVVEEDIISDINSEILTVDDAGNIVPVKQEEQNEDDVQPANTAKSRNLSEPAKAYVEELTKDAIQNYETYLNKASEPADKAEVQARIADLKSHLQVPQPETQAAE